MTMRSALVAFSLAATSIVAISATDARPRNYHHHQRMMHHHMMHHPMHHR